VNMGPGVMYTTLHFCLNFQIAPKDICYITLKGMPAYWAHL
jgi:hypothetical protein